MTLDMSPAAITARLREVGERADLAPDKRLDAKLDMSAAGIESRLREVSALLVLCRKLAASEPSR